eukprot:415035-Alexandrium_andersonii.AAC.1
MLALLGSIGSIRYSARSVPSVCVIKYLPDDGCPPDSRCFRFCVAGAHQGAGSGLGSAARI